MDDDQARARQLLGVGRSATADEVRAAYMDLVKVWHPDRFGSDARLREKAERQLRAINEAFALLTGDAEPRPRRAPPASAVPQRSSARSDRETRPPAAPASTPSLNRSGGAYLGWLAIAILVGAAAFYSSSKPPAATPPVADPSAGETPRTGRSRPLAAPGQDAAVAVDPPPGSDYMSKLSPEENSSLELVCADKKANGYVYQQCLLEQVEDAKAAPPPDYSKKTLQREIVERVCEPAKADGPAAYRNCQNTELSSRPEDPKPN